jgi:hypothetical protein
MDGLGRHPEEETLPIDVDDQEFAAKPDRGATDNDEIRIRRSR